MFSGYLLNTLGHTVIHYVSDVPAVMLLCEAVRDNNLMLASARPANGIAFSSSSISRALAFQSFMFLQLGYVVGRVGGLCTVVVDGHWSTAEGTEFGYSLLNKICN